jgi:hypothetical protein
VGTHAADRYVFLDADAEILDERYCARLYVAHVLSRRDLILSMVRYYDRVLPEFPIGLGRIDMANFTFSAAIAREHLIPTTMTPHSASRTTIGSGPRSPRAERRSSSTSSA